MAILNRLFAKPVDPWNDPQYWSGTGFGYTTTSLSGEKVSPDTAVGLSAYYACIRNISEDVGKLPIHVTQRIKQRREPLPNHPVHRLMNVAPNPEMTAMSFRETLQSWAMGWGNGWAEIRRNGRGVPVALWPIHPSRATLKRNESKQLFLEVLTDKGTRVEIDYANTFHLHSLGDGLVGESVAKMGCESIGRALAVQKHSAGVFSGGGTDRLALEHPAELKETARKTLRESWAEQYGGAGNHSPLLLQEGMKANRIGIPPEEAQMLETMQFTVEDLARWFRCPTSIIQHFLRAQGWSTIEHLFISFVILTLQSWAIRWEQEIERRLLTEKDVTAKHQFKALLRGDTEKQTNHYRMMREVGVYSVNDVRELEDLNPVGPEGDDRHVPENWRKLGQSDVSDTTGDGQTDAGDENLKFKREIVKALIADGTIGDVVYNLMDGKQLLQDVNIDAVNTADEPILPVVAADGRLISGEAIKNSKNETVSGDVLKGETPPGDPPATEPNEPEPPDGDESDADQLTATFTPLMEDAITRVLRREVHQIDGARKRYLDKGKPDKFAEWVVRFYDDHHQTVIDVIRPIATAMGQVAGTFIDVSAWCESKAEHHCDLSKREIETIGETVSERAESEASGAMTELAALLQR